MDKSLRNTLRNTVTQMRRQLEEAIGQALQGQFGIHGSGQVEPAQAMSHLSPEDQAFRQELVVHLEHIKSGGYSSKDAVIQMVREVAFTHLNRLCAYKMMESRGIIREAVSRGSKSQGVMFYLAQHKEDYALFQGGQQDIAYRHFLEWLGSTLSEEIGVLFSPHDPANRLFPAPIALEQVLNLLNSPELASIWTEDEAIGWVYQYFTPKELRDQARKESTAPRNSYELAFRNQFFTPRYVVEFLVDNTLGRTWYEMRQGQTSLKEKCQYLVRRPDEVFLGSKGTLGNENAVDWLLGENRAREAITTGFELGYTVNPSLRGLYPTDEGYALQEEVLRRVKDEGLDGISTQDLLDCLFITGRIDRQAEGVWNGFQAEIKSMNEEVQRRVLKSRQPDLPQAELLRLPVFIPFRASKDPQQIKIIDPACGSGHFLLYCYDLLETIYLEHFEKENPHLDEAGRDRFRREIPGMILAYNLHGIDIDPRAAQIAALALWLRAQRSFQELGLRREERPRITRTNIVCAEPMPGERELLNEFMGELQPTALRDMVGGVFDKMKLAGEAGSLLKIEEEIKEGVEVARQRWSRGPKMEQLDLWGEKKSPSAEQLELFDTRNLPTEDFWRQAEQRVIEALREYAHRTSSGSGLHRTLFADDAARGFAFIDLCRKYYDVVLMNPPFGMATPKVLEKSYLTEDNGKNLYSAFVLRWMTRLGNKGLLGCITDRTFLLLPSFQTFRDKITSNGLQGLADFGWGVLDAYVATCAYVIQDNLSNTLTRNIWFIDVRETADKAKEIQDVICSIETGSDGRINLLSNSLISTIPTHPLAHWVPDTIRKVFSTNPSLEPNFGIVRKGLSPGDSDRFVRVWWEVPTHELDFGKKWAFYANGGSFSPYYRASKEVVEWGVNGEYVKTYCYPDGRPRYVIRSSNLYGKAGLTYGKRGELLNVQILPTGQVFSNEGYLILVKDLEIMHWTLLGYLNTAIIRYLVNMVSGLHKEVGAVKVLPVLDFIKLDPDQYIGNAAKTAYLVTRELSVKDETNPQFSPKLISIMNQHNTLQALLDLDYHNTLTLKIKLNQQEKAINDYTNTLLGIGELKSFISDDFSSEDSENKLGDDDTFNSDIIDTLSLRVNDIISWIMGCIFGRWDIRLATGQRELPELADPFAPFPACSPGMLTGRDGLSLLEPPLGYPIQVDPDGVLVDDPDHSDDIVRRVRDVLEVIWPNKADTIEQEACAILGVKELRDYFRQSGKGGFWQDHIARYSKSRRKAPIYWLLQSSKKSYGLWFYYHRFNKDLLYKALVNYVEPKLRLEEGRLEGLVTQKETSPGKAIERQIEKQEGLISELRDFEEKLRRAANLNLEPDLNDGVVLNIAPLWEVVPWPEAKKYWEELKQGKYEWSSIARQLRERKIVK